MPTAPEPPVSLEAESFDSLSQTLAPPSLGLPLPSLELDFTLRCRLNPRISLGQTPFGQRNWISFRGGEWVARWGKGEIVVSFLIFYIGVLCCAFGVGSEGVLRELSFGDFIMVESG